jgi:hypothetical protein
MFRVPPREGQNRLWIPSNATWAVLPATSLIWLYSTNLPSELWGIGFVAAPLLVAWAALGLVLWTRAIWSPRRAPCALLVTPAAACLATLMLWGVHVMPPHILLESRVAKVFENTRVDEGDEMVMIESDRSNWGHGMFVHEHEVDSTLETAVLPLGPVESPFMYRREVERRAATLTSGVQSRGNMLIVIPIRDGWWYVYVDR